ncbi:hypothetical protein GCM10009096_13230 [Parasphingorhabdus litoris]|uniref:HTH cro/C1-type domain-containing protein n=1 Tax=Parasphingorhabdus litoris TaxID=394733 RepID=A0ABN1ACS7_9SPHN|nr:helix-turn-helix domain-containing protein [Parasphingorhabdus litoris]
MSTDKQNAERILSEFVVDNLGGSFKVILVDSAICCTDDNTQKERIKIPDFDGLTIAIATLRAIHERKLSGTDVRFLRKHLGMRSKELAEHLDISPEHLSRCENGDKVLSSNSEKLLRLLVLMKPYQIVQRLVEESDSDNLKNVKSLVAYGKLMTEMISNMKIVSISNDDDPLVFKFKFVKGESVVSLEHANDEDGNWSNPRLPNVVAA